MSKRHLLVLFAFLAIAAPTAILAGNTRPWVPNRFRVYDATGTRVGVLIDALGGRTGLQAVALVSLDTFPPFPVIVLRDFLSSTNETLLFASTNCTGTPFFPVPLTGSGPRIPAIPMVFVIEPTGLIFVSEVQASSQLLGPGSARSYQGGCFPTSGSNVWVVPGYLVPVSFTPPFEVVAEY